VVSADEFVVKDNNAMLARVNVLLITPFAFNNRRVYLFLTTQTIAAHVETYAQKALLV
jgi:hypothetical protein